MELSYIIWISDDSMRIWQREDYPAFTWDQNRLRAISEENHYLLGNLFGVSEMLTVNDVDSIQTDVVTEDICSSYRIEGEILARGSVRDSVMSVLDAASRYKENKYKPIADLYTEILDDANPILTLGLLNRWHVKLFYSKLFDNLKIGKLQVMPQYR